MAWQRLKHANITGSAGVLDSGSFTAYNHLKVIIFGNVVSGTMAVTFNGVTPEDSRYPYKTGDDGGTKTGHGSQPAIPVTDNANTTYCILEIFNVAGEEKQIIGRSISSSTGAGTAPDRREILAKWTESTAQITSVKVTNNSGGALNCAVGSYITVLGEVGDIPTTDEKTLVTNVPEGTRFEAIDTKKMYRRATNLIDGSDLKAYYKFDESSGSVINVAGDVTGNASLGSNADMTIGGTGTVSYGQTGTPSKLGNGMSFPATSSTSGTYGTCGTSVSQFNFLHGGTPKWTIAWWQKTSTAGGTNRQIFGSAVGDTKAGITIYYYSNNLRVYMAKTHPTGNNQPISTNDSSVGNSDFTGMETDGNWHLYVVTMDFSLSSDNCKICKDDGTKDTSNKHGSNTPDAITQNSVNSLGFRYRISNTAYIVPTAEYCEVSVWNRVLTDAEITQLYNSGAGLQLDTGETVWKVRGSA